MAEAHWLRARYRGVEARLAGGGQAQNLSLPDLAGYQVLHFAAHTRLDDQHPWRSALCIAGAATGDAGAVVEAGDIAGARLSARLAVLAGCASAGGTIISGEGVLGLTSAFLAAGVPMVVASLWPVSDTVMPTFTRVFYGELERGAAASEALRQAQLAIASNARTRQPCYWAGFLLAGDGSVALSIERCDRYWLAWVGAGLGLLALGAALLGDWRAEWQGRRWS
jgi:CHAT domain-containing protein